jgi:murein DD-endopeptidase MepM/ murein hydrolase activator NlpD
VDYDAVGARPRSSHAAVLEPPPGRYRGRRRVPTPPRSRYAAVVTTAVVGAGVVALGTSAALPDLKGQTTLGGSDSTSVSAAGGIGGGNELAERQQTVANRASRGHTRDTALSISQQPGQDIWLLPLRTGYDVSSRFGPRWGVLHPGVDLTAVEGTPYYAAGAGTVILARYNGGYGYNVMIQHDDGVVSVYGHSSKLIVKEGQRVQAGDLLGLTGNTGFSTGPHLHFEIRVNGKAIEPLAFMRKHGVDVAARVEVAKGGVLPIAQTG